MLLLSEAQMELARLLEELSLADRFFLSSFLSLASLLFSLCFSLFSHLSRLFCAYGICFGVGGLYLSLILSLIPTGL